jgi:hypothetical protein
MRTENDLREVDILVNDFDEFRDALPQSDAFEMTDCEVFVFAPTSTPVEELEKITVFLESVIHVLDIAVATYDLPHIKVIIREKRFSAKNFK